MLFLYFLCLVHMASTITYTQPPDPFTKEIPFTFITIQALNYREPYINKQQFTDILIDKHLDIMDFVRLLAPITQDKFDGV